MTTQEVKAKVIEMVGEENVNSVGVGLHQGKKAIYVYVVAAKFANSLPDEMGGFPILVKVVGRVSAR